MLLTRSGAERGVIQGGSRGPGEGEGRLADRDGGGAGHVPGAGQGEAPGDEGQRLGGRQHQLRLRSPGRPNSFK